MALFTKKKLTDSARQSWSAQFLEIVKGQREHWGSSPTLGDTWEEHDAEYAQLHIDYFNQYGVLGPVYLADDGYRPSGWRAVPLEVPGCLILATEIDGAPSDWTSEGVYYGFEVDSETGEWGYIFVGADWSKAKKIMKGYVKDWDLENLRKGPAAKKFWNAVWILVGVALLVILTITILLPIASALAIIGTELGILAEGATGAGLLLSGAGATIGIAGFADAAAFAGQTGDWLLVAVGWSRAEFKDSVPVFQESGGYVLEDEAPTDPLALREGGLTPLLLLGAAALIFV